MTLAEIAEKTGDRDGRLTNEVVTNGLGTATLKHTPRHEEELCGRFR